MVKSEEWKIKLRLCVSAREIEKTIRNEVYITMKANNTIILKTSIMIQHLHKLFIPLFTLFLLIPVSCVDLEYDEPPAGGEDPNLTVNITIAELKSRHTLEQYEEITDDVTFAGLVVSDDTEGNFFKQLVIQDATGGIEMRIEMSDLHNVYPVGRKVYVKAKGLWLGDYNGLIQLGAGEGVNDDGDPELLRIPESLIAQYIVPATYGNAVTPKTLTIDQLSLSDVSTFVRFENVQFISADAGQPYADTVSDPPVADNREIEDCEMNRVIVRTSGFASFAGELTPTDGGSLEGVLSVFGNVYQLTLRDLDDVNMVDDRCTPGGGGGDDLDEDFTGLTDNVDINLSGWANIAVKGTRKWRSQVDGNNTYAQATAFGDQAAEMESWFITPPIELDVAKKISFESAYAFFTHDGLTVWISSNFNGTDVNGATWQPLTPTIATSTDEEFTFISSGSINLSGFTGPVRVVFKYVGSGPNTLTTSFRIDNVKVEKL